MTKLKSKIKSPYRFLSAVTDVVAANIEKDKLKEIISKQESAYQLEIIHKGFLGSASSNQQYIPGLIAKAIRSSEFGEKASFTFPKPGKANQVKLHSKKVESLTVKDLVKTGELLVKKIKSYNPKILVDVNLSRQLSTAIMENSGGLDWNRNNTHIVVFLSGELVSKGDILSIGDYFIWGDDTFNMDEFADTLIGKFKLAEKIMPMSSGKYPVIFTPDAVSTLVSMVLRSLSAKNVYKGVSKWSGDLGQKVTDNRFTLTDDPAINYATQSTPYDDEGFVAAPLILINKGVLDYFFTDLKNAARLKIKPNGRGFGFPASPAHTNIVVAEGGIPSLKIIKGIKRGLLVDQILGANQGNPYSGDFSYTVNPGFLIEDGKLVGRVKDAVVSGNIFQMLKDDLREISSDSLWIGGSAKLPYLSFSDVTVVKK